MKYSIIGDEDTVLGFGVVGVAGKVATNAAEAQRAFQDLLADKETCIIIITERVAEMIRPIVDRYLLTESFPLVVEIPDRHGPMPGRPGIKEMVNAAIGLKI
ncbi:MAG TPA: V-type ATP synthase subunit F [Sedimentisphaerales bacterium]|nr:V-type ATP synthase subunit F [Sedimentisphaerales bacterium]HRS10736.1 V-type ATP synthase subunit F [Sedimentisphaerales bacterium]HRV47441.1 V-type ATP synthase subunit F [Sedimentisphaerales bacterium]